MGRLRKLVRTLAVQAAILFVLVGAPELVLRALGYGHSTDFFTRVPGRDAIGTNPSFPSRYFLPSYQIRPDSVVIPRELAGESFRAYVFGGSAPFGDIAPEYALGRFLQVLLRVRLPDVSIQVVNAALPGIDSGVVVSIAEEAAALGADCFIIYMGNNEVVGPHGVASVVGGLTPGGLDSAYDRFSRWLRGMRLAQWLDARVAAVGERLPVPPLEPLDPARYLETRVHPRDPRLAGVYASFRDNLEAILETAYRARIPVVLATVPSNVVDAAPIASLLHPKLDADERERFDQALASGIELEQRGQFNEALLAYELADAIDDEHAELQFRLAQALLRNGRIDDARTHFLRARDVDAQRYRASTRINDAIRQVAADRATQGIVLVDLESVLGRRARSPARLPGDDFFYDHAHLNFDGNYEVARRLLEPVAAIAALQLGVEIATHVPVPGRGWVGERLAFTEWDRLRVNQHIAAAFENPLLAGRPPGSFAGPGPGETDWNRPLAGTRALRESLAAYQRAIAARPDDLHLRRNAARLLRDVRRLDDAIVELETLLEKVPDVVAWWTELGEIQLRKGDVERAAAAARTAVEIDPRDLAAQLVLGDSLRAAGDAGGAIRHYRRALRIHPYMREARVRLAFLLFEEGLYAEAIPQLEAVLQFDPGAELALERLRQARERSEAG
jgi:tetratricopeptide (TPR) repeat protein